MCNLIPISTWYSLINRKCWIFLALRCSPPYTVPRLLKKFSSIRDGTVMCARSNSVLMPFSVANTLLVEIVYYVSILSFPFCGLFYPNQNLLEVADAAIRCGTFPGELESSSLMTLDIQEPVTYYDQKMAINLIPRQKLENSLNLIF